MSAGDGDAATLRVLHLEDVPLDAELVWNTLTRAGGAFSAEVVATRHDFVAALDTGAFDIILADHRLPGFDAHAALALARERCPDAPFIVVSGAIGEEAAVELLKQGAIDYVTKDRLERLPSAVRRALDEVAQRQARLQAEQTLRESEEKHRILLEESPDPIFSFTPEGRYRYVNRAFAEGVGKTVEDIVGKMIWDVFPKEEAEKRFAALSQAFRTGKEKAFEVRVPRADGDRYYLTTITPVKDTAGKVSSAICSSKDISARKQAEEALRESEDKYRSLVENVSDIVFTVDKRGLFTYMSPAAEGTIGYTPEEMIGQSFSRFILPDDLPMVMARFQMMLAGETESADYRLVTRTGDVRWARSSSRPMIVDGKAVAIQGLISDITARKQAEEALRESEERYRLVSEVITDIAYSCVLTESDGYAIDWIAGATEQAVGYSVDEIKALRCWRRLVVEEDLGLFDEHVVGLAPGTTGSCELRVRHKDGSVGWLASSAHCRVSADSPPVSRLYGGLADITERKRAAEALAAGAERLRASLHDTVRAMGAISDLRDRYTGDHQRRVARLAEAIAAGLGLDAGRCEGLQLAAEVHDVGKIGVPVEILSKPAKLSDVELSLVRQHAVIGREVLSTVAFDWPVAEIVGQHHERLDGSGYPDGLQGEEILLEARILGVADVVEAMASHRPYRPKLGIEAALDEVREGAGTRYDADVVAACEAVIAAGFALDAPDEAGAP